MQSAIVGMAQDFVGSNNINLLVPSGQFGTRSNGGEDAAAPRYIFTHLSPITRVLFPEEDDQLLRYLEDDGQTIEPQFYCPIIPMLLVNGSIGIGTGWSTGIPPHNPHDILEYLRGKLEGKVELPSINPYARGFTGSLAKSPLGYTAVGKVTKNGGQLHIEELPLGCWTDKYKETLKRLHGEGVISSFRENHTPTKVSFVLDVPKLQLEEMERTGYEKNLKLTSSLTTTNMHAFDSQGTLKKYKRPQDIIEEFFPVRLELYEDRMSVLKSETEYRALVLRNQARFVQMVVGGEIDLMNGRKSMSSVVMNSRLGELGFDSALKLKQIRDDNPIRGRGGTGINSDEKDPFSYMLNLPIASFTSERIRELEEETLKRDKEMKAIQAMTSTQIWLNELQKLEVLLPEDASSRRK